MRRERKTPACLLLCGRACCTCSSEPYHPTLQASTCRPTLHAPDTRLWNHVIMPYNNYNNHVSPICCHKSHAYTRIHIILIPCAWRLPCDSVTPVQTHLQGCRGSRSSADYKRSADGGMLTECTWYSVAHST